MKADMTCFFLNTITLNFQKRHMERIPFVILYIYNKGHVDAECLGGLVKFNIYRLNNENWTRLLGHAVQKFS